MRLSNSTSPRSSWLGSLLVLFLAAALLLSAGASGGTLASLTAQQLRARATYRVKRVGSY